MPSRKKARCSRSISASTPHVHALQRRAGAPACAPRSRSHDPARALALPWAGGRPGPAHRRSRAAGAGAGLSVISYPDTVKVTQVRDQQQMPFTPSPAPSKPCRHGAALPRPARNPQTRFHYLVVRTVQLLPVWPTFCAMPASAGQHAPARKHHMAPRSLATANRTSSRHRSADGGLRERRFLLVGDSGELDPEIL
jgi:hypothetical protein